LKLKTDKVLLRNFFYLLLLTISGCIETFEPTINLDTSPIVITGVITDLNPAQVEIAKPVTGYTKQSSIQRISGATVLLFDDQGNQEQLTEIRNGYYQGTSKGVVGRKYHINVQLPNNDIISSSPQLLKPCPSIDSLSLEQIKYLKPFGKIKVEINGLNLNLYMNNSDTLSRYYKWKIGGTYKRLSPLSVDTCYVTMPTHSHFVLGESVSKDTDLLWKKLKYIKADGTYTEGHSVEVSQYSLTKEAYDYWKKIEDQQNNLGSVFDPPPTQIIGNLSYIDDQNVPVLGFFEVSSIKKKRIFITIDNFLDLSEELIASFIRDLNYKCYPILLDFMPPRWCSDCSLIENSTKVKPSYWPE